MLALLMCTKKTKNVSKCFAELKQFHKLYKRLTKQYKNGQYKCKRNVICYKKKLIESLLLFFSP